MASAEYLRIRNELMGAGDELILSRYLKPMIDEGASWPQHFDEDSDVFNKNPSAISNTLFVIVKPRTETCGKTDGCEYGSWRTMAGDKLIKNEETGKLLGFKKILKFCLKKTKTRGREYKRSWVMEEYRLASKWNPKQDHVICKIRLLFQTEIGFLLSKHFSYSSGPLPATRSLPSYGYRLRNGGEVGAYLQNLIGYGNEWPSYVTNDVYRMHPTALVDPHQDKLFKRFGLCFFANRTEDCGYTDGGCDSGRWRIMEGDKPISSIVVRGESTFGYKRVFKFCEEGDKPRYGYTDPNGQAVFLTWIMEEYRLAQEVMKDKVLCVIKLLPR